MLTGISGSKQVRNCCQTSFSTSSSLAPSGNSIGVGGSLPMASASLPAIRIRLPSTNTVQLPPSDWVM